VEKTKKLDTHVISPTEVPVTTGEEGETNVFHVSIVCVQLGSSLLLCILGETGVTVSFRDHPEIISVLIYSWLHAITFELG
jgi:hypothetical protein